MMPADSPTRRPGRFPEVLILRHGETAWNLARRFQGAMDSPLTDRGRDQARRQGAILAALGPRLSGFDLRVSPQGRAQATAGLALAPLGRVARTDLRLREIGLGQWEGLTRAEVAGRVALDPGDAFWWMDAAPGGEGHAAVAARAGDLLAGLTGPAVLVTHGIAAAHLRGLLLGLPLAELGGLCGQQGVVYRLAGGREEVWHRPEDAR